VSSDARERTAADAEVPGVYTSLAALTRLQYRARRFGFRARQPVGSLLAGRHASRVRGRGLDFEEVRAYLPGDDVRAIDWRVTARTGEPHTRVYNEEKDRPALVVVDQRLAMFYGTRLSLKSVTAAEAAALAAWRVFRSGDRIGAVVFDDRDLVALRPHRSRGQVMRILQAITEKNRALRAESDVAPSPGMLNQALERALRLVDHDHAVLVASDFDGADSDTRRLVTALSEHNDVIVMLVLDPSSKDRLPAVANSRPALALSPPVSASSATIGHHSPGSPGCSSSIASAHRRARVERSVGVSPASNASAVSGCRNAYQSGTGSSGPTSCAAKPARSVANSNRSSVPVALRTTLSGKR